MRAPDSPPSGGGVAAGDGGGSAAESMRCSPTGPHCMGTASPFRGRIARAFTRSSRPRSDLRHTLGVPVAGGGRLDPARSGDGDGAERGRAVTRREGWWSVRWIDPGPPETSHVRQRGATGRGIVNPPIADRRGSRRIADRPWSAPVRGLLGIRAETRSLGPILTQEQLLRSGQVEPKRKTTSRSPGSSRPLRVLPNTFSGERRVRRRPHVFSLPPLMGEGRGWG
jgi:hypothetical protein